MFRRSKLIGAMLVTYAGLVLLASFNAWHCADEVTSEWTEATGRTNEPVQQPSDSDLFIIQTNALGVRKHLLDLISRSASSREVSIISISPLETARHEHFTELTSTVTIEGSFEQVLALLNEIVDEPGSIFLRRVVITSAHHANAVTLTGAFATLAASKIGNEN